MKYFNVYTQCKNKLVAEHLTKNGVNQFINVQALKHNYGFYRTWKTDDAIYYDCGPITYVVKVAE